MVCVAIVKQPNTYNSYSYIYHNFIDTYSNVHTMHTYMYIASYIHFNYVYNIKANTGTRVIIL